MDDDLIDIEATKRVANRALISAFLAFFGGVGAKWLPGPILPLPFYVIAVIVGISATLTLNHHEAKVIGGLRHVGILFALLGVVAAGCSLVGTVVVFLFGANA